MIYEFDWDPAKARSNLAKHGVSFEDAMEVFSDPLSLTRLDLESSAYEQRWITLGHIRAMKLLLVVHTHVELADDATFIRIISARPPTRRETLQYKEGDR